jgi:hypothetical protein
MSQCAVQKPSIKPQTASNADCEAVYYSLFVVHLFQIVVMVSNTGV